MTLLTSRIGQIDHLAFEVVDIPERVGSRIGQHEEGARKVDEARLTRRAIHIGTVTRFGVFSPRLAGAFGIGVTTPTKHFIGRIAEFGMQTQ